MNLEKTRLSPFPFPKHLAQFLVNQLDTPVEDISGIPAKKLHISRKRAIGKYIIKCLEKSDVPIKPKKDITLYISTSVHNRRRDKSTEEPRYSDVFLSEQSIQEIIDIFEDFFNMALIQFVKGCDFGFDYKKGKQQKAIAEFFHQNNMELSKSAFERANKMIYRHKKDHKKLINRVL